MGQNGEFSLFWGKMANFQAIWGKMVIILLFGGKNSKKIYQKTNIQAPKIKKKLIAEFLGQNGKFLSIQGVKWQILIKSGVIWQKNTKYGVIW